jgi:hypothetical protein
MDNISDKVWARLPVAVRRHIEKVEADLADVRDQMAEMLAGPDSSNVMLPFYLPDMGDQYLPNDCQVRFALSCPRRAGDMGYVEVRLNGEDGLEIYGSHPITIEPGVANIVIIKMRDD